MGGSLLGEKLFGSECRTEVRSSYELLHGSVERKMKLYSGVSEKGASGKVGMDAIPLAIIMDAATVEAAVALCYHLRHWIWSRRMYVSYRPQV